MRTVGVKGSRQGQCNSLLGDPDEIVLRHLLSQVDAQPHCHHKDVSGFKSERTHFELELGNIHERQSKHCHIVVVIVSSK